MQEQEAVALLRRHNEWRRGDDVDEMIMAEYPHE